ncbi:MAG TPA: LytR C-terminal domain-containing protein [Solirubrobacterales bacterium]|nr:LytR C-terminal domain-containing protein [Solirubrobacterales bacterium]
MVAFLGLALLALLSFSQGRDIRRLREWAGSAPERDAERKETTSEAAAERAEEMRRVEEAREAERRAEEMREERRRRREAGLPELTRGERLRERFGGLDADRGRLGEPRYLAALFAVFLLLVGVGAYAVVEGGGGDEGGGKAGKGRKAAAPQPGDVEVTVLNGTAVPGLAATYGDMLEQRGFQLGDVTNSESSFVDSVVMFEPRNGREAHLVAKALDISRVRAMTSDIVAVSGGAPVSVVVGEDNASTAG